MAVGATGGDMRQFRNCQQARIARRRELARGSLRREPRSESRAHPIQIRSPIHSCHSSMQMAAEELIFGDNSGVANMNTTEVLLGMLLLLFGAGLAYYYYLGPRGTQRVPNVGQSQQDFGRQSEVQRDFARVFSMTSAEGKEALIKRWMDRGGCDRTEAMRLATEEWRSDNR